jgi:3-carboxy-cis,cis-muconate cycloisomerase
LTTFAPIFVPDELRAEISDRAWLAAMLDAERALAAASARVGLVPAAAAAAIASACDPAAFDVEKIAAAGHGTANPAKPLVDVLRERVGDAARWVHFGATSQDVVDTAAVLVTRRSTAHVVASLDGAIAACARLAERYRDTPTAARTLLQQAVPTTFGAKSAGWLVGLLVPRDRLAALRFHAQLGGAAGTLAAFGGRGIEVLEAYASELGLEAPLVTWHAHRGPLRTPALHLDAAAAACAKIGLDVVLLAQTEVAEVAEAAGGGSSTMPHKRNPAKATLARACARLVRANVAVLTGGEHEHERAAGAWQAEWTALTETLAHAGGAAAAIRECLEGLEVFPQRMRENMTPGLYAERDRLGLDGDAEYLGSAAAFVDRALARYRDGA